MDVTLNPEPKWSKVDHLFVLLAENDKSPKNLGKSIQKLIDGSGFKGNSDETITLLADEPRKVTLMGLGKRDAITLRLIRTGLYAIGKLARNQRDRAVAVALPYTIAEIGRVVDYLSQSDYKYDSYITIKKDGQGPISAILIPPVELESKELKRIEAESRAIRSGIRTVRALGNAPANVITPTRLAQRAEEIARSVGVKATVYGKKEIERMKMGGLLAVNRGSAEEPRFIVLEYSPRKAKKHVALVGKAITFDSGGIAI